MIVADNNEVAKEVTFFDETFDIMSMDDEDLDRLETDGDWEIIEAMIDQEGGEEGYAVAQCLIAMPWEQPETECIDDDCDQEFGWFEIISGGRYERYNYLSDAQSGDVDPTDMWDFEESEWWAEYREPEGKSETDVQVQGQYDLVQNKDYTDS